MSRQRLSKLLAAMIIFAVAVFFTACATSHSGGSGTSPGTTPGGGSGGSGSGGTGGSGGTTTGAFAAGIGGAGQTSSAQFLIANQIPAFAPIPTKINSNGTLTPAKLSAPPEPNTPNTPMAMMSAIDPTGTFMYQAVEPGLYGYTIDRQTGNLTQMPNTPVNSSQNFEAVATDQSGKFVYASGGGQIFAYMIQPGTGQLSPVAGSPFGAAPSGQSFFVASDRIAISQNDKFLYLATASGIMGYTIDQTTGALTMIPGSPFGASAGAAFALVAPASGFLYETTQNTKGGTTQPPIYGYSIDPSSGALTPVAGSPFSSGCGADNLTSPASGKFLFGASCGMYEINASTGALTFVAKDPSNPNSIWAVFDPMGAFVWIVTTDQSCWHCSIGVTAFQVDPNTGNLTMVPNSFLIMQNDMTGSIASIAITH